MASSALIWIPRFLIAVAIGLTGLSGYYWHRCVDNATAEYVIASCKIVKKRLDKHDNCPAPVDDDDEGRRLGQAPARRLAWSCSTENNVGVFTVQPTPDARTNPAGPLEAYEYASREASQYKYIAENSFYDSIAENSTVPCWQRKDLPEVVKLNEAQTARASQLLSPILFTFLCCFGNMACCSFESGSFLIGLLGLRSESGDEEDYDEVDEEVQGNDSDREQ